MSSSNYSNREPVVLPDKGPALHVAVVSRLNREAIQRPHIFYGPKYPVPRGVVCGLA
jgi:hypothetical protein